nr:hypothetical protein [Mycobacterium sp. UM_NZ2]
MSGYQTPGPADRERLASQYRERMSDVEQDGWPAWEGVWSSGQVLVVKALLGDQDLMPEACERLAPSLWGSHAAQADAAAGYPRTWGWLMEVARG